MLIGQGYEFQTLLRLLAPRRRFLGKETTLAIAGFTCFLCDLLRGLGATLRRRLNARLARRLRLRASEVKRLSRCYEPDEGRRSFPAISFVQVVIGRKGETGKWIKQLTPRLLRIGSSAP